MNLSKLLFILIFSKILLINKLALNKTFFDFWFSTISLIELFKLSNSDLI